MSAFMPLDRETEDQCMRRCLRHLDEPGELLSKKLAEAIRLELTPRQRQMVELYYLRQKPMTEIAGELGVNVSTVSRTIARGRRRLQRCLRYTGLRLLDC